jgi:hypothetical protein
VNVGVWSYSPIVDADVASNAAIQRNKLAPGTANAIVVNDLFGNMTSTTQISATQGGTGTDSSLQTGIPHVNVGVWSYSSIVNADIAAGAAIARSKIAAGSPNEIVINDGAGNLTSEAQIAASQGGTGGDSSTQTGVAHVTSGVWSYSQIVDADVANNAAITRTKLATGTPNQIVVNDGFGNLSSEAQVGAAQGGTGGDSSAQTGIAHVVSGTWSYSQIVNADISNTAAIARTKLATGTPNQVVINDGSGNLSSEAQVSTSQGGTGQDFSSVGAGPFVITNSGGTMASNVVYTTSNIPNTIVLRDGSGNVTLGGAVVNSITSPGNLVISAGSGNVLFGSSTINQSTAIGSNSAVYSANATTVSTTPVVLLSIPTVSGTHGTVYTIKCLISLGDNTGGLNTGSFECTFKGKNLLGVVSVSSLVNVFQIADGGLTATNVSPMISGTNILIEVMGLAATTIYWTGRIEVVSQQF